MKPLHQQKHKLTPVKFPRPITMSGLRLLSAKWLFPGLVVAMVVGNQGWMFGPFLIGQMISWVNDLAATVIVLTTFRHNLWPKVLVACIILAKAFDLAFKIAGSGVAFDILLNILFLAAGSVIVFQYTNLVYKQVMIICLLNVPFMIMQVTGVGKWTHFLTTEFKTAEQAPTLFVHKENLVASSTQGRPSGLLHANNFLSLIVLFGLALHLSRNSRRFVCGTLTLCAMAILSMAKIVFLVFTLLILWLLIAGNHRQKLGIRRALVLVTILFGLYAVLLPGLLARQLNRAHINNSLFPRAHDIVSLFPQESLFRAKMDQYLQNKLQPRWDLLEEQRMSGYTYIVPILPYFITLLLILTPFYLRGLRKLRARFQHLTSTTTSTLLVIAIYPFASPTSQSQIFWFMAGFAFLPLFVSLQPRYFKVPLAARFRKE